MKIIKILFVLLIFSLFLSIHIPLLDMNFGFVSQVQASDEDDDPYDNSNNSGAKGVSEPSLLLLLGAGITGVVAYRKIKSRKKTEL